MFRHLHRNRQVKAPLHGDSFAELRRPEIVVIDEQFRTVDVISIQPHEGPDAQVSRDLEPDP